MYTRPPAFGSIHASVTRFHASRGKAAAAKLELRVGFLHLGGSQNGINRHGRAVATALRDLPGVIVVERDHDFAAPGWAGVARAVHAMRTFPAVDVIVVPESRNRLWAAESAGLLQRLIVQSWPSGRAVLDMHDVYPPGSPRDARWRSTALATLLTKAIIIHGEHERRSLSGLPRAARAIVIPLVVERSIAPARDRARNAFGLREDERVISEIGWIHQRKNYEFAVDLLSRLDRRYRMWFVGDATAENASYRDGVVVRARELGVADRLEVTGYVSEPEMASRLAATDVALTPYRDASASASLSTILGAHRPVVSHDLPVARDFASLAPGAVSIVPELELDAWHVAVTAAASRRVDSDDFATLEADRAPSAIARRYATVLRLATRPHTRRFR